MLGRFLILRVLFILILIVAIIIILLEIIVSVHAAAAFWAEFRRIISIRAHPTAIRAANVVFRITAGSIRIAFIFFAEEFAEYSHDYHNHDTDKNDIGYQTEYIAHKAAHAEHIAEHTA